MAMSIDVGPISKNEKTVGFLRGAVGFSEGLQRAGPGEVWGTVAAQAEAGRFPVLATFVEGRERKCPRGALPASRRTAPAGTASAT